MTDGRTHRWKKWHIDVGAPPKKRTRRAFESDELNIQPYRKNPKINDAAFLREDDERQILTDEVATRKKIPL